MFVVTLASRQLVDKVLKGVQCRGMLKNGFKMKVDDYLTREQLGQRMFMRPTQQRLQDQGVVAAFRGVHLYQLVAREGAAPAASKRWSRVEGPLDTGHGDDARVTAATGGGGSGCCCRPWR
jgi:hypothetical protein